MNPNVEDQTFMDGMHALLGMEPEEVEKILDELDADSLMELTDAISTGNKEAAQKVLSKDEDINDLFFKSNQKKKKHPVKPPKDYEFVYGDDVAIEEYNDETGKNEFISATVYKPKAPGNTIGVKIEGKPKMVDRDRIYKLDEMIMGMTGVPNLQRMQQLAGIASSPSDLPDEMNGNPAPIASPVEVEAMLDEPEEPSWNSGESCPVEKVMTALDIVGQALPEIKLADLKAIRQRLTDLQTKMNESFEMGRKKKKI